MHYNFIFDNEFNIVTINVFQSFSLLVFPMLSGYAEIASTYTPNYYFSIHSCGLFLVYHIDNVVNGGFEYVNKVKP